MAQDRNQIELELAKTRAALATANAEIARLKLELTELRLNPPLARRGNALPGVLTEAKISALIKEARETGERTQITDCPNLALLIQPGQKKISVTWMFRWANRVTVGTNKHKNRSFSLGQYRNVDIYTAREKALEYRRQLQQGKDPEIERNKAIHDEHATLAAFKTVNQVMDLYYANKIAPLSISQRRKVDAWFRPIREKIGNMPIQKVTVDVVLKEDGCDIERMWTETHKSGAELLGHIRRMISFAKKRGWFESENPAALKDGLEHILPKSKLVHKVKHHASMPYKDVPGFIPQLRAWRYNRTFHQLGFAGRPIPAYAVELLIRTGVRTKEVRKARFGEFDFNTMIWTVPGFDEDGEQRTKSGEPHYLPITTGVAAIYREMEKVSGDSSPKAFLFPSIRAKRRGQPINALSLQSLNRVMREHLKLDVKFVNHGFRSTLRTFCSAEKYPERWWDIQVGHVVGDKTRQAYPLEQLIEERRGMMQAWDDHCDSKPTPKPESGDVVVNLVDKRRPA
jgi:integrase